MNILPMYLNGIDLDTEPSRLLLAGWPVASTYEVQTPQTPKSLAVAKLCRKAVQSHGW
jgi:hypothetical protein